MYGENAKTRPLTTFATSSSATNQTSVNLYYCGLVLPPPDATSQNEIRREREKERESEWKRLVEREEPAVEEAHMQYRRQILENAEDGFISRKSRNKDKKRIDENTEKTNTKGKIKNCKKAVVDMFRRMRRSMASRNGGSNGTVHEVLC